MGSWISVIKRKGNSGVLPIPGRLGAEGNINMFGGGGVRGAEDKKFMLINEKHGPKPTHGLTRIIASTFAAPGRWGR